MSTSSERSESHLTRSAANPHPSHPDALASLDAAAPDARCTGRYSALATAQITMRAPRIASQPRVISHSSATRQRLWYEPGTHARTQIYKRLRHAIALDFRSSLSRRSCGALLSSPHAELLPQYVYRSAHEDPHSTDRASFP